MVLTTLHIRLAIVLASFFTWNISCKKGDVLPSINNSIAVATNPDNNCILIVHPEWIDEITYFDTTSENYNAFVLKAHIKNTCTDTIAIGMNHTSLSTSYVEWFFPDAGGVMTIFTKSDSFHVLVPGDSLYLYLTTMRAEEVHKIDSLKIDVPYKIKNQLLNNMVKINGHDFTYRK